MPPRWWEPQIPSPLVPFGFSPVPKSHPDTQLHTSFAHRLMSWSFAWWLTFQLMITPENWYLAVLQLCLTLRDPGHCDSGTSWFSSLGSEGPLFLTSRIPFSPFFKNSSHFFWESAPSFHIVLVKLSIIVFQTLPPTGMDARPSQANKIIVSSLEIMINPVGGLISSWTNQNSSLGLISRCWEKRDLCFCWVCLTGLLCSLHVTKFVYRG